jgi:nucleoside-diphosphate-sugar epimerase
MRMTIFGAAGRLGRPLVQRALAVGYEVTAFVRDPAKLDLSQDRLTVMQGDARAPAQVEAVIRGAEVVVCAMATSGSRKDAELMPLTRGIENIIVAMRGMGVDRLIVTAANAIPQPNDRPSLRFRALSAVVKRLVPLSYRDTSLSIDAVRASDRAWTIVRLSRVRDAPPSGLGVSPYLERRSRIGIAIPDAVEFIVSEAREGGFIHAAPAIWSL